MTNKEVKYEISPSDDDDWLIISLKNKKVKLDFQKEVLSFRYDCIPHPININGKKISCSKFCCYAGCYVSPLEIKLIEKILPELKKGFLTQDSMEVLYRFNDEFYLPEDYDEEENLYKTRCAPFEPPVQYVSEEVENKGEIESYENNIDEIPETYCLFLMENGFCSVHSYLEKIGKKWYLDKFNICTSFPLDLRIAQNDAEDAPYPDVKRVDDDCSTLKMMDEYENFLFTKMDCINLTNDIKTKKNIPYILNSQKYLIITRLGEDLWIALNDFAEKYRKEN